MGWFSNSNDGTPGRGYKAPPSSMLGPAQGYDSDRNIAKMHNHWQQYPACNGAGMADSLFGFGRVCYQCGRSV